MRDAQLLLIADTGLKFDDAMVLACLRTMDGQRLVHQQPCPPDDEGHIVLGEAAFFRRGPTALGLRPPGGLPTFRRLLAGGWLTILEAEFAAETGAQLDYGLSPAAVRRFETKEAWKAAEDLYRECAKLAPRLRVVA